MRGKGAVGTVPRARIRRAGGDGVIDSKGVIGLAGPGERGERDLRALFINRIECVVSGMVRRHQSVADLAGSRSHLRQSLPAPRRSDHKYRCILDLKIDRGAEKQTPVEP